MAVSSPLDIFHFYLKHLAYLNAYSSLNKTTCSMVLVLGLSWRGTLRIKSVLFIYRCPEACVVLGTQWVCNKYLFNKWVNEWTSKWSWTSCPLYLFSSCDFWMHCLVIALYFTYQSQIFIHFTSVWVWELFACHIGANILFFPANMVCFIFSNWRWTLGSRCVISCCILCP